MSSAAIPNNDRWEGVESTEGVRRLVDLEGNVGEWLYFPSIGNFGLGGFGEVGGDVYSPDWYPTSLTETISKNTVSEKIGFRCIQDMDP